MIWGTIGALLQKLGQKSEITRLTIERQRQ